MYPRSVRALQADALFVSALQRSDELNASQIWRAVAVALTAYGGADGRGGQLRLGRKPGDRTLGDQVGVIRRQVAGVPGQRAALQRRFAHG